MNRVAIRAHELILCGFEATPHIFYFILSNRLKRIPEACNQGESGPPEGRPEDSSIYIYIYSNFYTHLMFMVRTEEVESTVYRFCHQLGHRESSRRDNTAKFHYLLARASF